MDLELPTVISVNLAVARILPGTPRGKSQSNAMIDAGSLVVQRLLMGNS